MSLAILPEQPQHPLAQMLTGVGTGLQEGLKLYHQKKQGRSLGRVLGLEGEPLEAFSTLSPEQQKVYAVYKGKANKEITPYQKVLTAQREKTQERQFSTSVHKYIKDIVSSSAGDPAMMGLRATDYTTIHRNAMQLIAKGYDPDSAIEESFNNLIKERKETKGGGKAPKPVETKAALKSLSPEEIKTRFSKMPGSTHEQKLKNLKKVLEQEGYKVEGL